MQKSEALDHGIKASGLCGISTPPRATVLTSAFLGICCRTHLNTIMSKTALFVLLLAVAVLCVQGYGYRRRGYGRYGGYRSYRGKYYGGKYGGYGYGYGGGKYGGYGGGKYGGNGYGYGGGKYGGNEYGYGGVKYGGNGYGGYGGKQGDYNYAGWGGFGGALVYPVYPVNGNGYDLGYYGYDNGDS